MLRDDQLRIIWISRIDYEKNSAVESHVHDSFYQLLFVINGEGTITMDETTFNLQPQHAYFIPKGCVHSFRFTQDSMTIDLKFNIMCEELEQLLQSHHSRKPLYISNVNEVKNLFKLSTQNLHKPNELLPYRIDVGFKGFLLSILVEREYAKHENELDSYSLENEFHPDFPIVEYLNEHIQSKISLEDIAKHFNFHPHYLIELFRKELGTTPMNFLQRLRLEKSKEYLEFTNLSITEISDLVGLTPPYFSRLFRDRIGIAPSEYREKTRTVIGKDIVLEQDFSLGEQPAILQNL
jgi:AraC family transcriptional regulator, arabinose operon regulatory protein